MVIKLSDEIINLGTFSDACRLETRKTPLKCFFFSNWHNKCGNDIHNNDLSNSNTAVLFKCMQYLFINGQRWLMIVDGSDQNQLMAAYSAESASAPEFFCMMSSRIIIYHPNWALNVILLMNNIIIGRFWQIRNETSLYFIW